MKIVHVQVDDWEALYVDGKLVDEGSSINWKHFITHNLKLDIDDLDADLDWLDDIGNLPDNLEDVLEET